MADGFGFGGGGFAGGYARGLIETDPVGSFFGPIERALERRTQVDQFNRSFAEEQRQFNVKTRLDREELDHLRAQDELEGFRSMVPGALESLTQLGTIYGEAEQRGESLPESVRALEQGVLESVIPIFAGAGFSDPEGKARRAIGLARADAAKMSPEDFRKLKTDVQEHALSLVFDNKFDLDQIAQILRSTFGEDPAIADHVEAVVAQLPSFRQIAQREGEAETIEARTRFKQTEGIPGVDLETRRGFAFGRGGTTIKIGEPGGALSEKEKIEARGQFKALGEVVDGFTEILENNVITDETVGFNAFVSENVGARLQAGARFLGLQDQVQNLGEQFGLDINTVRRVLDARQQFDFLSARLARFMSGKAADRLAVADREFAQNISGLENIWTDAATARKTVIRMRRIAKELQDAERELLLAGEISLEETSLNPDFDLSREEFEGRATERSTGFAVEDETGTDFGTLTDEEFDLFLSE